MTVQTGARMAPGLAPGSRGRFRDQGYLSPVPVFDRAEATALLAKIEAFEAGAGAEGQAALRHKGHLVLPWLATLIRDPRLIAPVADLLGPDLLCWSSNAFIKDPGDGHFVSWHQDATYWGLSAHDVVTAWVALTPSNPENGCMRVLPGSHRWPVQPHRDTHDPANLLTRGQEIAVEVDESNAVDLVLAPGEMSLHHVLIAHASGPNCSAGRRIGMAIRYIPTSIRQASGYADSATLVAGVDRYGHFRAEPRPARENDPDAWAFYRAVLSDSKRLLYRSVPSAGGDPAPGPSTTQGPAQPARTAGRRRREVPSRKGGETRGAN